MEILTASPKPQRRILVVVDSDPRTNPRVAEAVRMAGGVGVWDQVTVHEVQRAALVYAISLLVTGIVLTRLQSVRVVACE